MLPPRFALNYMATPSLDLEAFFALARALEMDGVEIRNDLEGVAVADGTPPEPVRAAATAADLSILSVNALQRFNDWTAALETEATRLADYAAACGAQGIVLVPTCDGSPADRAKLEAALSALAPILAERALTGLVEPLGFCFCSLRSKSDAVAAIEAVAGETTFRLVHDTFHHHLAGEADLFPQMTGLVHISGVTDPGVGVSDMRDPHRVLVDAADRLDNVGQIAALREGGYLGPLSFEPFAPSVHGLTDLEAALRESTAYIAARLSA